MGKLGPQGVCLSKDKPQCQQHMCGKSNPNKTLSQKDTVQCCTEEAIGPPAWRLLRRPVVQRAPGTDLQSNF